ncbi:MAG: endolytic transglycosylase MltG [Woeseiaceae bacterium]
MRPIVKIALIALVVVAAAAAYAGVRFNQFLDSPMQIDGDGVEFEIPSGASFGGIADELEQRGIVDSSRMLRIYARYTKQASRIQAGDYLIASGSTPRDLLEQFSSGAVQLYSFTIIEGWNRWDLLNALHDHPEIDAGMTDEDWPAFLESLGAETAEPEGLFLPETYRFPRNADDRTILRQAYEHMQATLAEEWASKADDAAPNSPYEALILASIIEKETGRSDERQRISGVFTRRLAIRMRLQTDPTVIYGIGPGFNGNLTRKDLRTPTPYNTYTQRGLPPTPIAMPGRAAIFAALHPAAGEELYFVATGIGDGGHTFSTTKDEHDAAVAAYLRQLRSNRHKD